MKLKLLGSLLLIVVFAYSCSEGKSRPTFLYKKPAGDGVAAKIGKITITEQELTNGIESDLYEAEKKIFDIKFNKLRAMLLEKLMAADPKKKGLTNDQYMEKYIAKNIKITQNDINKFVKEKKIPADQLNKGIEERIRNYLMVEKKREAVDNWLAVQTKKNPVEVFIPKPRRPTFNVAAGDSPFFGNKNAKVTIVEFSDFQCPFCARGADILREIKKRYGKKVKVAFKQYPLPFHKDARQAAVASLCANEQKSDYFWKMHDWMFANQQKLDLGNLKQAAKKLGVNSKKFDECLGNNKYMAQVEKELKEGQALGVKSTPTFFVNGQLINGAQPIEIFAEIIDEELKK
jgi:protein-disulfide isomerase